VQPSAFPDASTPDAAWAAEQFEPLADKAVAVTALPVRLPVTFAVMPLEKVMTLLVALFTKGYAKVSKAGTPVNCEYGSDRCESVVMLGNDVVAVMRLSNGVLNVADVR
jgi:hypothetical protein